MRLGELRTITKDFDNKLIVMVSCYDDIKGVRFRNVEFDMSNDNELFLRIIDDD